MEQLLIPRPLATQLLFEAQKMPDEEVCGLLGARDGVASTIYPVRNTAASPHNAFVMDESEQIQAMQSMRERGESLLAIYHSHPTTPPEPSARDLEEPGYPDAFYLIISLNIKGVLEMRGWQRRGDTAREVPLRVMA